MKKVFKVEGMTCASCQSHVKKAVDKVQGVKSCNVNLLQNNMDVEFDESVCKEEMICDAVIKAGYGCYTKEKKKSKKKDNDLIRLIISFVLLIVLMYFSMGNMMFNFPSPPVFDMKKNPMGFSLIQFILLIPIIYINRKYFISGYKKLFHLAPNMDSLVAIGATFSTMYGIYCMFMISLGHTEYHMYLYFESAAMILTFVSLGKYLEHLSKKKTTSSLEALMNLNPKKAYVIKDGKEALVDASDVLVGDVVIIKKGDSIPVDGIIIEGSASIDEANITGESIPKYKKENDQVIASTILTNGYIKVKALRVNQDTEIANLIRLVEEAANSKAPISKLADKISGIFVPTILIIALLVFVGNLVYASINPNIVINNPFELSLNFAVTVIVIACPCALGLATPVAIMVSTGKGAENGLLIRNAEVLENTHLIKTIVLDKTGTITKGYPVVTDFVNYDTSIDSLGILYAIESKSEHPLANAIINFANKNNIKGFEVSSYRSIDGEGISGVIDNETYYIGNVTGAINFGVDCDKVLETIKKLESEAKTVILLTSKTKIISLIAIKDAVKESSKEAIKLLKKEGIEVIMLTGDSEITAKAIAAEVGIDKVVANKLPSEKLEYISNLKRDEKHLVAMVGDGVNDAPSLSLADIGIAIGSGSDIALNSSDIILKRNDLIDVINVIRLSKRTIRTIKVGLFWAFFYNFICVILATGLFYYISNGTFKMEPMYGAIAMSISSVSVVLNALTIKWFKAIKSDYEYEERKEKVSMQQIIIEVDGMMCKHCKMHVEEACKKVANVCNAEASLENKNVVIECFDNVNKEELIQSIKDAGYDAK